MDSASVTRRRTETSEMVYSNVSHELDQPVVDLLANDESLYANMPPTTSADTSTPLTGIGITKSGCPVHGSQLWTTRALKSSSSEPTKNTGGIRLFAA